MKQRSFHFLKFIAFILVTILIPASMILADSSLIAAKSQDAPIVNFPISGCSTNIPSCTLNATCSSRILSCAVTSKCSLNPISCTVNGICSLNGIPCKLNSLCIANNSCSVTISCSSNNILCQPNTACSLSTASCSENLTCQSAIISCMITAVCSAKVLSCTVTTSCSVHNISCLGRLLCFFNGTCTPNIKCFLDGSCTPNLKCVLNGSCLSILSCILTNTCPASGTPTVTPSVTSTATSTSTPSAQPSGPLANPGFETGTLDHWSCEAKDHVVKSPVHSGHFSLKIVPGDSTTGECDQTVDVQPNTTYTLQAYVRGKNIFIGFKGGPVFYTAEQNKNSYTALNYTFTTGSSTSLTIFVEGWYGQNIGYADDFSLTAHSSGSKPTPSGSKPTPPSSSKSNS